MIWTKFKNFGTNNINIKILLYSNFKNERKWNKIKINK